MSEESDAKPQKKSAVLNLHDMSLAAAIEALNKRYGANTVLQASSAPASIVVRRIPTGIDALDYALGGGWPAGRIIELHGPFSSFKSTTALIGMRSVQRSDPNALCVYVDLERTFDRVYADKLGIDPKRMLLVNPDSGEQAVNVINDIVTMACPLFVVLDSLAALVPTVEMQASVDQAQMGVQARLVNRMMRVLIARMKRDLYDTDAPLVTLVVLNQLREKLGVMFGNPETTPGGRGKDFFYSVIVRLAARHSKALTDTFTRNTIKKEVQVGQTVGFKVVKNKCGGPQHEAGEFCFYERDWNGYKALSFNNEDATFEHGAFHGVIDFVPKVGFVFDDLKAANAKKFVQLLRKHPAARSQIRRRILRAIRESKELQSTEDTQ